MVQYDDTTCYGTIRLYRQFALKLILDPRVQNSMEWLHLGGPILFTRPEPPAGHTMARCQPWGNQINQNWTKSGPQSILFWQSGSIRDLIHLWFIKFHHSTRFVGQMRVSGRIMQSRILWHIYQETFILIMNSAGNFSLHWLPLINTDD